MGKIGYFKNATSLLITLFFITPFCTIQAQHDGNNAGQETVVRDSYNIIDAKKINATCVEVLFSNDQKMLLDFYGDHLFRLFQDNSGKEMRPPKATPEAQILVDNPRAVSKLNILDTQQEVSISTGTIKVVFNKNTSLFKIINQQNDSPIVEEIALPVFDKKQVTLTLKEHPNEYYYGGGVQNGRFSHKGKVIAIENENSWTDGGVASPTPFYWSSRGYGLMWYTFKKGSYDFGSKKSGNVQLAHETDYLDVFFMINEPVTGLLNDFYQLTGNPVLIPKFGFYEGH